VSHTHYLNRLIHMAEAGTVEFDTGFRPGQWQVKVAMANDERLMLEDHQGKLFGALVATASVVNDYVQFALEGGKLRQDGTIGFYETHLRVTADQLRSGYPMTWGRLGHEVRKTMERTKQAVDEIGAEVLSAFVVGDYDLS
jgi:hypothetical protein